MKRIVCFIISLFIVSAVLAITPERIDTLKAEAQQLLQAKQVRVQEMNQIEMRLLEIQGILKEYNRESLETKKEEEIKNNDQEEELNH